MITVYNCVATQHDLRFVLLAAAVCLLSSATAMGLLDRVQKASGLRRGVWLTVTATVIGIGVWATHFIAILGFQSTLATSYDPLGTTASLVVAILLLGIAIFIGLPFNKVKIDQTFIRNVHGNEQGATIVRAIVSLCQGLNLKVLAEGVETNEELQFLTNESCSQAQGYLIGRPGEIGEFASAFAADELPVIRLRRRA